MRYARICSRKDDFIYRHRRLSLKRQQQGYKLVRQIIQKSLDELEKFGTTLMELRSSVWMDVLVKHILWAIFVFLICAWLYYYFSFTVNYVICRARISLFCFLRVLNSSYYILALDANFRLKVIILFFLSILTFAQYLCSHSGWLLLNGIQLV